MQTVASGILDKSNCVKENKIRIASIATATPPFIATQEYSLDQILSLFGTELSQKSREIARKVFLHPSIETRHLAFEKENGGISVLKNENADQKVDRFSKWAIELSFEAASKSLEKAGISPEDVDIVIVNTCTGFVCPGISSYLLEKLQCRSNTFIFDLSGAGCGGAIPNLQMAASLLFPGKIALCIAVEICSAAFRIGNDPSLIVSNAIFGDGAAAVVLWDRPLGYPIIGFTSEHDPAAREHVRFIYKNGMLYNQISSRLPAIVGEKVPLFLKKVIRSYGYEIRDIAGWALHPGGDRMIKAIGENLGLSKNALTAVVDIYKKFGNMSSPTALFCLERILACDLNQNSPIVLCAYGAGMSAHVGLILVPSKEEIPNK